MSQKQLKTIEKYYKHIEKSKLVDLLKNQKELDLNTKKLEQIKEYKKFILNKKKQATFIKIEELLYLETIIEKIEQSIDLQNKIIKNSQALVEKGLDKFKTAKTQTKTLNILNEKIIDLDLKDQEQQAQTNLDEVAISIFLQKKN